MGDEKDKKDEATQVGDPRIAAVQAMTKRFAEGVESIRARTDLVGKGIIGIGTAVLTAAGAIEFANIFPYSSDFDGAPFLLLAGVVLFTIAIWQLFTRHMYVQRALVILSDPDQLELGRPFGKWRIGKCRERALVERIYSEVCALNGVESLRAYESRGRRLRRVSERIHDPEQAKVILGDSQEIAAEVGYAQQRALHAVIRDRANRATSGTAAAVSYLLIILGIAFCFVANDKISAVQADSASEDAETAAAVTRSLEETKVCLEATKANLAISGARFTCPAIDAK